MSVPFKANQNHTKRAQGSALKYSVSGLLCVLFLTFLDQWTKYLSVSFLKGKPPRILLPGILELKYLENTGIAFGLFAGKTNVFLIIWILFFFLLLYLYRRLPKERNYRPLFFVLFLTAGGALGNFIDRIIRGYVVDFIYISLIDFPIFNLADIYVVTSGILLTLLVCFRYQDEDFRFLFP